MYRSIPRPRETAASRVQCRSCLLPPILSVYLAAVDRTEEALTAVQEAVDLCHTLAAEAPTLPNDALARSLEMLSIITSDMHRGPDDGRETICVWFMLGPCMRNII